MKIDFNQLVKNLDGETITSLLNGKKIELNLKLISTNALLTDIPSQGKQVSGLDKFKNYELAKKINLGGEIEISVEEITTIKEKVGEVYSSLIVGVVYDLLEKSK